MGEFWFCTFAQLHNYEIVQLCLWTIVTMSSDLCDEFIKIIIFQRIFSNLTEICVVIPIFVLWIWLTPHFRATMIYNKKEKQFITSLAVQSLFKPFYNQFWNSETKGKSGKIQHKTIIWHHIIISCYFLLFSELWPKIGLSALLQLKHWQFCVSWLTMGTYRLSPTRFSSSATTSELGVVWSSNL